MLPRFRATIVAGLIVAGLIASSGYTMIAAPTTSPESSPEQIVQGQVAAYNAGDVAAFVGYYADDAELFDLGPAAAPIMRGKDALAAHYRSLFDTYQPQVTILSRITNGDFIVDREHVEGKGRMREGVAIYQIVAGKIRRVWFTP